MTTSYGIASTCDDLIARLSKSHPRVKWQYFVVRFSRDDSYTPVESVRFLGSINIGGEDFHVERRVDHCDFENVRMAEAKIVDAFTYSLVRFVMGTES